MSEFCEYIIYVDESGDHGIESPDPEFPVFVLTFCIFKKADYISTVVPELQRLKFKHFGHDMVIFHERDIRKATGPFTFLTDAKRRAEFMHDLSEYVEQSPFQIIAIVIRKDRLIQIKGVKQQPYHFAMTLGLERVEKFLLARKQNHCRTHVIFESRGKKEDNELELEFRRICDGANYRNEKLNFEIIFAPKQINSSGLQLADLTARPVGRHVMNPKQPNRAFEIIEKKLDRSEKGKIEGYGLKCYP